MLTASLCGSNSTDQMRFWEVSHQGIGKFVFRIICGMRNGLYGMNFQVDTRRVVLQYITH